MPRLHRPRLTARRAAVALAMTTALLTFVPALDAGAVTPEGSYQKEAISVTNVKRTHHDRARLRQQDCLQRFAVRQARRMATRESMFHQGMSPIMTTCGMRTVGENVAYGYVSGRSVVSDGWMHSAPHRANLLSRSFRLIGIGARRSASGVWYVSQVFGAK
jgi:uncharacterized protein YkwD